MNTDDMMELAILYKYRRDVLDNINNRNELWVARTLGMIDNAIIELEK